jgi:hypothetical protein
VSEISTARCHVRLRRKTRRDDETTTTTALRIRATLAAPRFARWLSEEIPDNKQK